MNFFRDLGLTLLERWKRADLDERAFPDVAASVLAERPPSAHVDPFDVVRWVHGEAALPHQASVTTEFGQPPITVFHCESFCIDVLFWVDGTTTIHQHGFSGAFHVMHGSSLQSAYRFSPKKRYSERLLLGDLALGDVKLLARGEVEPIVAGSGLVHSLFHLERPSVSVVVRTPSDAFAGPQYSYSRSGLAWDPFHKPQALVRQLQTLELLHKLTHPDFDPVARASLERADAFSAFRLLDGMSRLLETPQRFSARLEGLALRHEGLLEAVQAYAEEEHRDRYIIARRRLAKEADHRLLLALLLNVPRREPILRTIGRAVPERDPVATVLRWLGELARLDAIHAWVADTAKAEGRPADARILDVKIDEASLAVARRLLEGAGESAAESEPASPIEAALRQSLLLRPLFLP